MYRAFHQSLLAPFGLLLGLSATRPVFTAANVFVVDGKIVDWIDWNDATHVCTQADPAKQCLAPLPHADFAGQLCANFTGVEVYESNRGPAQWTYGHSGSGSLMVATITPTGTAAAAIFATKAPGQTGCALTITASTGNQLGITVSNGATNLISRSMTCPRDVPRQGAFSYLEGGGSPEYRFAATGIAVITGDSTSAPTSGNSTRGLVVGAYADLTTSPFAGRIHSLVCAPSESVRVQVQSALTQLTQVAA